jgi:hypothetical protein
LAGVVLVEDVGADEAAELGIRLIPGSRSVIQ